MLKTVLRLDSEPQICMRYLKSFNFSTTQNNTVHIVMRIPVSDSMRLSGSARRWSAAQMGKPCCTCRPGR